MEKNEKILILGADGFIGSNLIKSLLRDGMYEIRAFDLFKDGHSKNLKEVENKIEIFSGNFLNRDDIGRALEGIDYVFHFISLTTPGSSLNDPLIDVETNIKGTIVLLEECVKNNVKRIIFSSSGGAIYGNQQKDVFFEDDTANPISPYAISKLTIERYLEFFKIHHGLDYLILRYSNPYGPGQNIVGSQGIIPIFINLIRNNKSVTIFGDGKNVRDYIFIDDLVENTKKIFKIQTRHTIYNIGSGDGKTINEIVALIKEISKKEVLLNFLPARDIDVRKVILDVARIKAEIDYHLETQLEEGIRKTWNWVENLR
jgi:UDP-glucose 4-epimerase